MLSNQKAFAKETRMLNELMRGAGSSHQQVKDIAFERIFYEVSNNRRVALAAIDNFRISRISYANGHTLAHTAASKHNQVATAVISGYIDEIARLTKISGETVGDTARIKLGLPGRSPTYKIVQATT